MSGALSGVGSALQGATQLAAYVLGTNTTTNSSTSGTTTNSSYANTAVASDTDTTSNSTSSTATNASSDTNTVTNNDVNTTTTNVVQNTANAGLLSQLQSLATSAINNSSDPSKTTGLLSGIIQQATDAMTSVFGQQNQSGGYNSAAATTQTNDIMSRAAADAAQAILGYQTTEQGIGQSALNQMLNLTSGQTTTNNVNQVTTGDVNSLTNSNSLSTTNTNSNTNVADSAVTNVTGGNTQVANTTTQSSSHSGMSVVCTWMYKNKKLSARRYYTVSQDLWDKQWYTQKGYLKFASPLVSILERDHTNLLSRAILSVFAARTEYVCAQKKVRGCKKSVAGWLSRLLIAGCVTPFALYFWFQHIGILPQTEKGMV